MPPALEITLYGKNDEKEKTYQRQIVPFGMLKKAARLMDAIENPESKARKKWYTFWQKVDENVRPEERQADAIADFVVELFDFQFTKKQLETGADLGEMMSVLVAVMARANATVKSNPTIRQSLKKN